MKLIPRSNALKLAAGLLLPAVLLTSPVHAADTVPLFALSTKIGHGKLGNQGQEDREYTLITKAGTTYRSRGLTVGRDTVELSPGLKIPLGDVAEIKIKHRLEWQSAIEAPASAIVGEAYIFPTPVGLVLVPVLLAVTAVGAPVTIAMEGIKRLLPAKVITVQP